MDELTIAFKIESPPSWLPIGRTAENNWRTVEIDCSYWFNMSADGEVVLMYKSSCGMSPYPLLTEREGDNIIWRPKSGELVEGVGRLQAFFEVGTDVIGSSDMISCEVDSSLLGVEPGTDPGQTELPWALDIIEQIAELSGHYPKIIDGDLYIWDSTLNEWVEFEASGSGAVESVNGKTGVVVLDASDVHALPDSTVIPVVPQMATAADMSDWTQGKTVDAATLKADYMTTVLVIDDLSVNKADRTDIPTAVSELTNDSGFVTAQQAAAAAPVQSVNGMTGAVTIPTGSSDAVLYTPQTLTDAQKEQARDNIGAASSDSVSDLDAIVTGRTQSVFSEEVESTSSSYVYGKVNYSANAGEKITVNISGTAFTGTKTTLYFFYGDSTTHTSVGLVDLNTDLEFVLPDSITAIDTYRANEAQPGTVIFTVTKVSSSGGIVGNVQELNAEVSGIQDTLGDNTIHVEKDHTSGTLNLEVLFSANAGEEISVKPYGTAFAASFCNVYARYAGESSNTNLGRAYIGQDNSFTLTNDTEKLYIYTLNAQAGTASVDIRKLGLKDDVADLLVAVNPIKGKKLNFLGDSITYGGGAATRFTDVLASMLDCTCRNYGISGSTITYDENRNPMCVRYADMDDDADIVAVMGGTNDYWNNKPLGKMGDTANTTFYGALDIMISGLIAKYPSALIYMVTPPHGDNGGNFDGSAKSNSGSMQDIANAVCEVASKYSIPVLDVFNAGGLYPSITDQKDIYYSDGVHLNAEGQKKLAQMHAAFILSGGLHSGRANRYDYATETWVQNQGYQTAQDVQTAIAAAAELPTVTASDNGKFLRVVSGAWAAATVSTWQGGSY